MLAFIEITMNIITLAGISLVCLGLGIILKSSKLNNLRKGIEKLEKEMLNSHAEILRLQKELAGIETKVSQAPIVPMHDNSTETAKDNLPDTAQRKKVLTGIVKSNP